ncbi:MAG: HAD family hydrolase [Pseudomonadota bacterium]
MTTKKLPLRGIVFDFDGTLAKLNIDFSRMRQEVLALVSGYRVPLPRNGLKDLLVLEMITAGAGLVSQYQPGKEAEFIERAHALISDIEMKAAQGGSLFEGTRDLLQTLQHKTIKTGVVTRNCLSAVQTLFPDIHQYTHTVITREQTSYVKPHPAHLLMMLKKLDVAAGRAAMVGDHPMDIRTGKNAGVCTIGVLTGFSRREDLEQAGADLVLGAATDILAILA